MLLDSSTIGLVLSLEFAKKQGFKLKKIEKPIYMRNSDSIFNKKRSIKHTIEISIFYKGYRKRMEINIIGEQK